MLVMVNLMTTKNILQILLIFRRASCKKIELIEKQLKSMKARGGEIREKLSWNQKREEFTKISL